MIVWTLLLVTLVLAALGLRLLWRAESWSGVMAGALLSLFVFLYGAWLYLSIYAGYTAAVTALGVAVYRLGWKRPRGLSARRGSGYAVLSIVLLVLCVLYYTGTVGGKVEKVSLQFPLKSGDYIVFQGGRGYPTNVFHSAYRGAVFAVDLVRLNARGARGRRVFSERLEDYAVFGDTIYAPCGGTVESVRDDNPDNIPPDRTRGPSNLNAVIIAADSFTVFLGHLKHGGVFVQEGEAVQAGDPVGLVGNSGFSLEPHLHIQAHMRDRSGAPWWSQPPLLMLFEGDEYRLFEVVRARRQR